MSLITTLFLMEQYGLRLTMEQLAEALGWGASTLHNKLARGELEVPTYVDGKRDTALLRQALDTLAYWLEHGETPGAHDMNQRTHDALQERLK